MAYTEITAESEEPIVILDDADFSALDAPPSLDDAAPTYLAKRGITSPDMLAGFRRGAVGAAMLARFGLTGKRQPRGLAIFISPRRPMIRCRSPASSEPWSNLTFKLQEYIMPKVASTANHHAALSESRNLRQKDDQEFGEVIKRAAHRMPEHAPSVFFESIVHALWRNHAGEVTPRWWRALRPRYERVLLKCPWFDDKQVIVEGNPSEKAIEAMADLLVTMHNDDKRYL